MTTFPIPDALESQHHGAGHALAATAGERLVRIVYLRDVLPETDGAAEALQLAINDPRLAPVVRELQALGTVSIGMCSGWTFTEL